MNYISFDMGSESMAAFCQLKGDPEGFAIDLQEYAQKLLGKDVDEKDIEYLWNEENGERVKSARLRTLISIEPNRQPAELPESHAKLNFIDGNGNVCSKNGVDIYNSSLFRFFYKKDQGLSRNVIPNPKIPFQEGAGMIIPEIESKEKERVRYKPEILIQHMMTQVIRNLVLKSSKLRNKK
ncbi:MAG: hypothetical protein MUF15_28610, partial [Acidobacteria bacterium]|nr:hypothetical protein [Acidobacteriota bacterium]